MSDAAKQAGRRPVKKTLRWILVAIAIVLGASGISGCSGTPTTTVVPAAYGQVINGVGHCYYLDDPYEAQQMLADGRCPAGWVPTLAPVSWEEEYFAYYDSPAYYNFYVLPAHRTVYVHTETAFQAKYSVQITSASRNATYKGSNGKTIMGPATAKLKFGSGSGSAASMGSGSLRGGATTAPTTAPRPAATTAHQASSVPTQTHTTTRGSGGSLRRATH
jgi:hypothetical protein